MKNNYKLSYKYQHRLADWVNSGKKVNNTKGTRQNIFVTSEKKELNEFV